MQFFNLFVTILTLSYSFLLVMTGGWERPYNSGYRHKLCQERSEWAKVKRFLVADTQLYKRLCPSIGQSVNPSVREHKSKSRKVSAFDAIGGCVWSKWVWSKCVWSKCLCPTIRNDIVTPCHLFAFYSIWLIQHKYKQKTIDFFGSGIYGDGYCCTFQTFIFLYIRVNQ